MYLCSKTERFKIVEWIFLITQKRLVLLSKDHHTNQIKEPITEKNKSYNSCRIFMFFLSTFG